MLRASITFEATPEYLHIPQAPAGIRRYKPTIKLIALVREPAERAYAAWNMYRKMGEWWPLIYAPQRETRPFALVVADELDELRRGKASVDPAYVGRGLYADQLERYLALFPREQLLVLDSAELQTDTAVALERVLQFLDLPSFDRRQ